MIVAENSKISSFSSIKSKDEVMDSDLIDDEYMIDEIQSITFQLCLDSPLYL